MSDPFIGDQETDLRICEGKVAARQPLYNARDSVYQIF